MSSGKNGGDVFALSETSNAFVVSSMYSTPKLSTIRVNMIGRDLRHQRPVVVAYW